MKITVVITRYNVEKYVEKCALSLVNQTYRNLELIFVNDGSTDGTEKLAKSYTDAFEEKGIHFIYLYQENVALFFPLEIKLAEFSLFLYLI